MRSRSSATPGFLERHGPLVQPRPVHAIHLIKEVIVLSVVSMIIKNLLWCVAEILSCDTRYCHDF